MATARDEQKELVRPTAYRVWRLPIGETGMFRTPAGNLVYQTAGGNCMNLTDVGPVGREAQPPEPPDGSEVAP